MPSISELTRLYTESKDRLEKARGPPKKQKAVEGVPLSQELVRDGAIVSFVMAVIFLMIAIAPPPLHDGFDLTTPPLFVKPDWYLLWSLGPIFLAKWPLPNPGIPFLPDPLIDQAFMGTILVNVAFVVLLAVPFVARGKSRRPIESPMNFAAGIWGLMFIWWMSIVGIADIIFAFEVQPAYGRLHSWFQGGISPDPSELINVLGIISLQQTFLFTFLAYWLMARHRPKYESKLNANYYKAR